MNVKMEFTLEQVITESYQSKTLKDIFDIKFFGDLYLATCGSSIVIIYEVNKDNHSLLIKLSYCDQDCNEEYYCLEYSECNNTLPLILVAGKNGIIKGINCVNHELEIILIGHGNSINDLRIHPVDDGLLLSASKDESIRLWNLRTSVCIAIFAGIAGHRGEVFSIDVHQEGNCFVSAGQDKTIKIWNLEDPQISHAIDLSYTEPRRQNNLAFLTLSLQKPIYSTESVHNDFIYCVSFYGNLILSNSRKDRIVLWIPDRVRFKGAATILREYTISGCGDRYTRFEICEKLDIFAIGNAEGSISVFSLSGSESMLNIHPSTSSRYSITSDDEEKQNDKGRKQNENTKVSPTKINERFESNTIFRAQAVLRNDNTRKENEGRQIVAFDKSGQYLAAMKVEDNDSTTINFWYIKKKKKMFLHV